MNSIKFLKIKANKITEQKINKLKNILKKKQKSKIFLNDSKLNNLMKISQIHPQTKLYNFIIMMR
jgi:hypothetical protein